MPEAASTEQQATSTQGATPAAPVEQSPQPQEERKGGEKAILADLARERDQRQALQKQVDELKPMKAQMDALRGAFGSKEAEPGEDIVATLQQRVSAMEKENVVSRVARSHGITDDKVVKALYNQPDEQAMHDLAELLKSTTPTPPPAPAPDPSQASAPMSEQAAAEATYAAFFPSKT